jgi:hypothetical protein
MCVCRYWGTFPPLSKGGGGVCVSIPYGGDQEQAWIFWLALHTRLTLCWPTRACESKFFLLSLYILDLGPYSWLSHFINDWLSIVFDRLYIFLDCLSISMDCVSMSLHYPFIFLIISPYSFYCLSMSVITLWLSVRIPSCLSIFLDCLSTFLDGLSIFLALSQYP